MESQSHRGSSRGRHGQRYSVSSYRWRRESGIGCNDKGRNHRYADSCVRRLNSKPVLVRKRRGNADIPDLVKFPGSIRFRTGCGIHADYDADRGSHRYEQTDRGTDFPVWRRILQPAVADQLHGHCLRDGKNPAEQILQMADAAFWNHVRVTMRLCFRRDRDELSINSGRFGFGI